MPFLFIVVLKVLAPAIRQEIKEIQIGKEVKPSLFSDDMILSIENPKDATKKLLELINEFGKIAGYKINIQKSVTFPYNNNYQKEKLRKLSHLQSHQKEYLGINLTKEVNDLYLWDFPGGPVVKTPCFHCRGHGFNPWSGK